MTVTVAPSSRFPRAAWAPLPTRSCLLVHGRDAATFVDHFTTASVAGLEPGDGRAGFFTNARGQVLTLASIMRTTDGLWIDAAAGVAASLLDHLEHHHIREAVEFADASAARASFLVLGEEAVAWLAANTADGLPARPLAHGHLRIDTIPVDVARLPWCGSDGCLLQAAAADGPRLEAWLTAREWPRVAAATAEAVRIEAGWPDQVDIPAQTLPQELDPEARAISFTKGCYLGQETVARLDALGHVNRRLVGLATMRPVAAGSAVRCGDETVATATSSCSSPRLAAGLSLAIVPVKVLDGGRPLSVDGELARVVPLPVPTAAPEEILLEARRFRVVRLPQPCADGNTLSREVVVHPGSVVVVPMVSADEVCLVEVARVAVGTTLLELPAGTLDREEPLAAAAARELAEETGYRSGRLEAAGSFWMSPGILRERMHLFVARDLSPGPQALEPGEQIRTRHVAWAEAIAMCLDGRIEDAKTIAGILLLDARRRAGG